MIYQRYISGAQTVNLFPSSFLIYSHACITYILGGKKHTTWTQIMIKSNPILLWFRRENSENLKREQENILILYTQMTQIFKG